MNDFHFADPLLTNVENQHQSTSTKVFNGTITKERWRLRSYRPSDAGHLTLRPQRALPSKDFFLVSFQYIRTETFLKCNQHLEIVLISQRNETENIFPKIAVNPPKVEVILLKALHTLTVAIPAVLAASVSSAIATAQVCGCCDSTTIRCYMQYQKNKIILFA